jgi:transposase IS66 family protein
MQATALAEKGEVELAFCWAHVRRRFYDLTAGGVAPIASEALQRIAPLYAIEKDIRGRGHEERRDVRQERSRPILAELQPAESDGESAATKSSDISTPATKRLRKRLISCAQSSPAGIFVTSLASCGGIHRGGG